MVGIPEAVHNLVEWEIAVAYDQGYRAALADIAARHVELSAAWQPIGWRRHEQKVAERIAEMRRCARALRSELDSRADRRRDADWPPVAPPGHQRADAA